MSRSMKSSRTRWAPRTLECPEVRSGVLALGAEDSTGLHLVRLAEELDEDGDAVDIARPPEARLPLLEVRLLQIVLQGAVRLGRLVAEGEADDQVDIGCADVGSRAFGELPDQVSRGESAGQVDAFPPRTEVAEQRDQGTLAARRRRLVVVRAVLAAAQNPITSRRRLSACSRPRRGSRRRSA